MSVIRYSVVLIIVFLAGVVIASRPLFAGAESLPPGHGYMLIRFKLGPTEKVDTFALTSVDTREAKKFGKSAFQPAGSNGWMALAAMPQGRYFWSEYESIFGSGVESVRNLNQGVRRTAPDSASDTFEIVPGVVNYVGDWQMRVTQAQRARLEAIIEFDKATLERYLADYPDVAKQYEIYLSMMGKKAVSLAELTRATAE